MYRETDRGPDRETKIRMEGDGKAESDIRRKTVEKERQGQVKTARGTQSRAQDHQRTEANERLQPRETEAGRASASS